MVMFAVGVIGVGVFGVLLAMGASRAAGLGAGAEGFIHDFLDGSRAAAAFGAAAQTAIDLPGRAREVRRPGHNVTHVVVSQDVAGTNNHGCLENL